MPPLILVRYAGADQVEDPAYLGEVVTVEVKIPLACLGSLDDTEAHRAEVAKLLSAAANNPPPKATP